MAQLRTHPAVITKFDAFRVDPRQLKVTDGYNVRDFSTPEAVEKLGILKEQIREKGGVVVPLEVRQVDDEMHVVSGHRRLRAVMELIAEGMEIDTVPATAEPRNVNDSERLLNLVLHNGGEPLSHLEKAEVVRRLLNMGWEREKIASRMGYKTPKSIADFELLLSAPEQIIVAIKQGEIAPSTGLQLVRQHGEAAPQQLPVIREAARQRGKQKGSLRDITPRGGASASEIEQRNERRLADFRRGDRPSDMSMLDRALATLIDFDARGISAEAMADACGTRAAGDVSNAADWLFAFSDALRQREDGPLEVERVS